ncbi:hypothetical protein [Chania multitudinisentens]|nr:hypothetical protein [Chania multitudinisentens]
MSVNFAVVPAKSVAAFTGAEAAINKNNAAIADDNILMVIGTL